MGSLLSLWWVIFLLPVLVMGIVFGFCPHKVIQFRARLQENMFEAFNMDDEVVDRSIYSTIFGESYSKRLKAEQERPREFKILMIWVRMVGFFALFLFIIMLFLFVAAAS
jgi:hypothetical protein